MANVKDKILLVEGKEELRAIPELIEANGIVWEINKKPIVYIEDCNGYKNLVKPEYINTMLLASGLKALGIILDADNNPVGRWQSIRNACLNSIPDLPDQLPENGLIHDTTNQIRFGIWMMPDNKTCGMLETFLRYLIPTQKELLWELAMEVTQIAKNKGAPFGETQSDKANIYTWLAWQNPPGRQLHQAIKEHILNPKHPYAQTFVTWFKNLYNLIE